MSVSQSLDVLNFFERFNFILFLFRSSITEACVWGTLTSSMTEKRLACKQIVLHLLHHHFKINTANVKYTATELDSAFELHNAYMKFKGSQNNAENLSVAVIKTFDELAKTLRSLDGLPLVITSVLGQSPVFRYCELNPILPNARFTHTDEKFYLNANAINEGVIQFGRTRSNLIEFSNLMENLFLQRILANGQTIWRPSDVSRQRFMCKSRARCDRVSTSRLKGMLIVWKFSRVSRETEGNSEQFFQ